MAGHYRHGDTIAAIATPAGRGGIGIVRVSGDRVAAIADAVLNGLPVPRQATYRRFRDPHGAAIDSGIALYFPAPHSFTGEDVLELQGHGGLAVMNLLLDRLVRLGARLAQPGEFSLRAFLNDKIDLMQAEAIADLINSSTAAAARSALRSLHGELSQRIDGLVAALIDLRVHLEAAFDFPDEDIERLDTGHLGQRLGALHQRCQTLVASARRGHLLREGIQLVLLGLPNAGKSSLLNRLSESDAAIVTDVPGTTRDVLRLSIDLDGIPCHLVDTAGLRDGHDPIEQEGVRRAHNEAARADQLLLIVDEANGPEQAEEQLLARLRDIVPTTVPLTVIRNKIDLTGHEAGLEPTAAFCRVYLSARTADGLDLLRAQVQKNAGLGPAPSSPFLARQRHLDGLQRAAVALEQALGLQQRDAGAEFVAEELRQAQLALGELTGQYSSEELLGRIFATFCIGK